MIDAIGDGRFGRTLFSNRSSRHNSISRSVRIRSQSSTSPPAGGPAIRPPVSNLDSRTLSEETRWWFALATFCVASLASSGASAQESVRLQGILRDGTLIETQVTSDGQLQKGRSLNEFRRLSHRASWFESPGVRPLRIVTVSTGERFPVRSDGEFRFSTNVEGQGRGAFRGRFYGLPVSISVGSLRSVAAPRAARDLVLSGWPLAEDFWTHREGTLLRVETPAGTTVLVPAPGSNLRRDFDVTSPLAVELAVVWPKAGTGSLEIRPGRSTGEKQATAVETGLRLRQRGNRLSVERIGPLRAALAARTVPVQTGSGVSRIRITIDEGITLSLDGRVLVRGSRDAGRLHSLTLTSPGVVSPAGQSTVSNRPVALAEAPGPVLLGCLLQTRAKPGDVKGVAADRLSALTHQGDQVYGSSARITPRDVHLKTEFGPVALAGSEVRSVHFPRPSPREYAPLEGDICRVRLAADSSTAFFGPQRPYELLGEVRLARQGIQLRHPILQQADKESATQNPLSLPWPAIQKIEPLFRGKYRLLSTGPWHLGAKHLPAFSPPEPDGTFIRIPFELPEVAPGKAWLSMEVADLEPASENTLRATANLNELRRGFLTTHVALNQVPCRTLNRHCEFLSPLGQPQRIRIPLPAGSLKKGRNLLQFQQNPSRTDPRVFDDCEVRRITLEFDAEP